MDTSKNENQSLSIPPIWKNELTITQQQAVSSLKGPLLILAGAGSGKTRVLTYRIVNLLLQGEATQEQILAVTFTNKAAGEMRNRITNMLGELNIPISYNLWINTFHAFCVKVLKEHIHFLGFKSPFTIYDGSDQQSLIKKCLKKLNIDEKVYPAKNFRFLISEAKSLTKDPLKVRKWLEDNAYEDIVVTVYDEYKKECEKNNALDFGDLLLKTYELFLAQPDVLAKYQNQFKFILIDEYQDTNAIQYGLIKLLAKKSQSICAVGDEDQSIYAWRGSDITNILNFEKDFANCKTVKLEENFRSSKNIVKAASHVISNNSNRNEKHIFSSKEDGEQISLMSNLNEFQEARFLSQAIKYRYNNNGTSYEDIAVFYRTHAQSRVLEEQLRLARIPYQIIGGIKFYERKEIKDLLCYLRLCNNPADDVALKRIINSPVRGIGKTTVEKIENIATDNNISMMKAINKILNEKLLGQGPLKKIDSFFFLMQGLIQSAQSSSVLVLLLDTIDATKYEEVLRKDQTPEAKVRLDNILEFKQSVENFEQHNTEDSTLQNFLESTALLSDTDQLETSDQISLMTIHSAKGLEYKEVFLVGCEEGLLPHVRTGDENISDEDIEEERRLTYVAITRAKEKLFLSYAKTRKTWGYDTEQKKISRFIEEIPEEYIKKESALAFW
ncbi:MAG: UvrD-helicase domain-containing protein [Bdellovibrionales bacterium]|nr:UvrD-helicase domain-containing protein [Bdellovibrionales bacterium]